jgi:membrane associated rhomboid family serine protease
MGYQDREYYQEDRTPSGVQLGGDLSYTWRIVIINCGLFLANFFLFSGVERGLTYYLSLHPSTASQPLYWYQFLSYSFVHDPNELGHLFWNMVWLVVFGNMVEQHYGRREFLRFYLLAAFVGGLFWGIRVYLDTLYGALVQPGASPIPILLGASGAVTAVILLFCLRFPFATINLMLVLPVPAWVLGAITIVSNLLQVGRVEGVAYDVHLTGVAFAIAYYYFNWNLTRVLDFTWLSRMGSSLGKLVKPRPKLKVFEGDEDDDAVYRELETEADRILAKISHDGEGSLTAQERQTLERYSRLMRQKHR